MSKKKLRTGFTTGTAAAAAAKGALLFIIEEKPPERVEIELLTGDPILIPIEHCVMEQPNTARCTATNSVEITGGDGVGVVTKPGLEVPPGEPAINPGPRKMINQSILTVLNEHVRSAQVSVEIDVPKGGELAQKTLNERLGIIGGISILGTTGIVRPLSHESYTATIESALSVAEAMKNDRVVLTTGRRSERYSQNVWPDLPEESFIQIGDYFEFSLHAASQKKINSITIAAFFGKLTRLADWANREVNDSSLTEDILNANTARHAFDFIYGRYPELIAFVGKQVINSAKSFIKRKDVHIRSVVFDYEGKIAFDSDDG